MSPNPSLGARVGDLTPGGLKARYGSPTQALLGARVDYAVKYLGQDQTEAMAEAKAIWVCYQTQQHQLHEMVELVQAGDVDAAVAIWNGMDQAAAEATVTRILGERDKVPSSVDGRELTWHSAIVEANGWDKNALVRTIAKERRDRVRGLTPKQQDAIWSASDGTCAGCGVPVSSHRGYTAMRKAIEAHPDTVDVGYPSQAKSAIHGRLPVFRRVAVMAKCSPEHVLPHCQGGSADDVVSCCGGCNYSRHVTSLDDLGSAAYRR